MKRILIAISLLATPLAFSSTVNETSMNVPFGFRAGSTNLPAGHYRVRTELSPGGIYRIYFQNDKGHQMLVPLMRIDNPVPASTNSGFVFQCETGATCQLSEVHNGGGPAFRLIR